MHTWIAKLVPTRLMPSTMSTLWSIEMQSGLHAAMRSSRPPPPLMYRMIGTWGWVDLGIGGREAGS